VTSSTDDDALQLAYEEFRGLVDKVMALSERLDHGYDADLSQQLRTARQAMDAALERYKRLLNNVEP
jgi:hypothetical protein